jgi:SAM-dependent methyltransferase
MSCPICISQNFIELQSGNFKNLNGYVRCRECKSIYLRLPIPSAELGDYYSNYYTDSNMDIPEVAKNSLLKTIKTFENYRSKINTICDIGYGAGTLLSAAEALGWKCAGSEFADKSIRLGVEKGWRVHKGSLGPFDVVTMIETLEHVTDPRELVKHAAKRLRKGGLIYGTTPNSESLNARMLKDDWSIVTYPEHPIVLSGKALAALLAEMGFTDIKVQSRGLNPYDLLFKLQVKANLKQPKHNTNRVEFGYAINAKTSSNVFFRFLKTVINSFLARSNLGDSLVFSAVKEY